MKTTQKLKAGGYAVLAVLVFALTALGADWVAKAINVASGLATVGTLNTGGTNVSVAGTVLPIPYDLSRGGVSQGAMLTVAFHTAGVGTSNLIAGFEFKDAAGNITTTDPLRVTNTCNGTTNVIGTTQLTAAQLNGVVGLLFDYEATQQTNIVTIDGIWLTYGQ